MFRTDLILSPSDHKIHLKDKILTIGSCFSENIGAKLSFNKIDSLANPLGIVYNPISLFKILTFCCRQEYPADKTFINQNGIFYNFDLHSDFSAKEKEKLKLLVEEKIRNTSEFLMKAHWLIITFGTAYIYEHRNSGTIVNNCHKIPAREFDKKLLNADQISVSYEFLHRELMTINSDFRIIFTLSPVRHIKETLEGNQLSKSVLRVAINQILENHPETQYFPSYEIMMDDLRDYRFYEADMIHPNKVAIDYIWEKFALKYFDKEANDFFREWKKLQKSIHHKPFHPESESHQQFLKKTIDRLYQFKGKVDISNELQILKKQLR
ncbi:GSCFA domain-containing protein [soil metagenome]